jgi:glucosamine kinase
MILIAESGSTKTTWVLVKSDKKKSGFVTGGFNPYIQKREQISGIIKEEVIPNLKDISIEKIFFYGAGCSTETNKKLMQSCFKSFFNKADIEIEHDLIAAARCLWFNETGIVSILGTGSNSCVYDGANIIDGVPSLGFILGDEGSGAYMGKILVRDFLYRKMPEDIAEKLKKEYLLDTEKVLEKVYKKENPNRWLAAFSIFIRDNIKEEYFKNLVTTSMRAFFDCHIRQYKNYKDLPLGVVGSIGYYYKDFFENVAQEYGFTVKKVIKSPIDELVRFHVPAEKLPDVAAK